MVKVELQVQPWQESVIQAMVLLSFTMQLMLLVLAEFRRRMDSGMLRAVIWSAYMLADSTATYTLGHLSLTSRLAEHELMSFWAPFLLLHLGGQDNITAYAIEDNQLWLRHLQALAVQVAAAANILYVSTVVNTQALLRNAAVLMLVLGVVKYGERVWALRRAGSSASGGKYQSYSKKYRLHGMMTHAPNGPPTDERDTEGLLRIAHLLLDVPKDMFQGPLPLVVVPEYLYETNPVSAGELYKVVEMQLSLMHDVVYSKAVVIYTWYGLCIRVISPVFTAIAFVLFHMSAGNHHYSGADVPITYVLFGGAVMLETVSMFRAMISRWPSVVLGKLAYESKGRERCVWGLLAHAIASIRRFVLPVRGGSRWWWSDSMGQHNLFDLCVGIRTSRASRIVGWMGIEDWWHTMVYSSSVPVSTTIKELVVKQVLNTIQGYTDFYNYSKFKKEEPDHIINSRGRAALKKRGMYERLGKFVDMELDESILVWHIATDIYLRWHKDQGQADADDVRRLTEVISNYMLFLLATRPYMLPDSVSRTRYVEMCYCLTGLEYTSVQDLASLLNSQTREYLTRENINDGKKVESLSDNDTLHNANKLARELVSPESGPPARLEMIAEVWMEMLCYAGYRCSGYSHAKQLSNGGELLTVAALVVEYRRRGILDEIIEIP